MNNRERRHARSHHVDRLIDLIEEIQRGKYVGRNEVISRRLFPKEYGELLVQVDERDRDFQSFFTMTFGIYEYRESIHGKEQFRILMLSAFHISIRKSIDHKLLCWKDALVSNKGYSTESRTAAERIDSTRDQDMIFESTKKLRGDCTFIYQEDHYTHPPLIFEIAWSQSTQNLEARAMSLLKRLQVKSAQWSAWISLRHGGFGARFVTRSATALTRNAAPLQHLSGVLLSIEVANKFSTQIIDQKYRKASLFSATTMGWQSLQLRLCDFIPARVIKAEGWDKVRDMDDAKLELDASTMLQYFDDALKRQN
ncbi:hypothetical protein F5Y01DRAFT_320673 [Xylaria sp. FL0043]|nr:hypothetical protein F5Y01DRAFT_320673 [Xylaria sp. FL0043]